jgi:DNA-binding CsgD family transcriptional regulator
MRHEITLPLPPDGERDRRLMLFRSSGSDFTDADALALHLLRPHLITLHLRQRRRREGVPDLTPRQMQILTLVAAGLSNVQVARAIGLSQTTVGKHLENAYARLDVNSRTAAVAKVYPLIGNHIGAADAVSR